MRVWISVLANCFRKRMRKRAEEKRRSTTKAKLDSGTSETTETSETSGKSIVYLVECSLIAVEQLPSNDVGIYFCHRHSTNS